MVTATVSILSYFKGGWGWQVSTTFQKWNLCCCYNSVVHLCQCLLGITIVEYTVGMSPEMSKLSPVREEPIDREVHADNAKDAVKEMAQENRRANFNWIQRNFTREGRTATRERRKQEKEDLAEQMRIGVAQDAFSHAEGAVLVATGNMKLLRRQVEQEKARMDQIDSMVKRVQEQGMLKPERAQQLADKRAKAQKAYLELSAKADAAEASARRLEGVGAMHGNVLKEQALVAVERIEKKIAPLERRQEAISARMHELNDFIKGHQSGIDEYESKIKDVQIAADGEKGADKDIYLELIGDIKEQLSDYKQNFADAEKERATLATTLADVQSKIDVLRVPAKDYARRTELPRNGEPMKPMKIEKPNRSFVESGTRHNPEQTEIDPNKIVDVDDMVKTWNEVVARGSSEFQLPRGFERAVQKSLNGNGETQPLTVGVVAEILTGFISKRSAFGLSSSDTEDLEKKINTLQRILSSRM